MSFILHESEKIPKIAFLFDVCIMKLEMIYFWQPGFPKEEHMKISEKGQGLVQYPIFLVWLVAFLLALGFSAEAIQEIIAPILAILGLS